MASPYQLCGLDNSERGVRAISSSISRPICNGDIRIQGVETCKSTTFLMPPTPHSPPETPRQSMAVEIGKIIPRAAIPKEATKSSGNNGSIPPPANAENPEETTAVMKVSSSNPVEAAKSLPETEDTHEESSEQNDDDEVLPHFDWADLESRYTKSLEEADQQQADLVDQFDKYADVGDTTPVIERN